MDYKCSLCYSRNEKMGFSLLSLFSSSSPTSHLSENALMVCLIPISIYSKGEQRLPRKSLLIHASYQHTPACISFSISFSCSVILHCLQVYMIITWALPYVRRLHCKKGSWLKKMLTALAHLLAWVCSPYFKMFNKLRHSSIKHQPDNKTGQELFNSIPWTKTSAIYSSRKLTIILTKHKSTIMTKGKVKPDRRSTLPNSKPWV